MGRKAPTYTSISLPEPEVAAEPTPASLVADGVLNLRDAAAFCGKKLTWLRVQVRDGVIASFMLDGKRVIPRKSLVEFLAKRMAEAEQQTRQA